jgi:hypothetical protein
MLRDSKWNSNRHWAVAYQCSRCKTVQFDYYDSDDGSEGNLQCTKLPDGWSNHSFHQILCPNCAESYKQWFNQGGSDVSKSKETSSDSVLREQELQKDI